MELLLASTERMVNVLAVPAPGHASIERREPFVCLLWDAKGGWSTEDLATLAARLLEAGCVYAVCGGAECERWHDAVDEVFLEREMRLGEGNVPFVMTSWHTDQSMNEVAFFALGCTESESGAVQDVVVLTLGADAAVVSALRAAILEEARGLREAHDDPDARAG